MTRLRSAVFSAALVVVTAAFCVACLPMLLAPRRAGLPILRSWARVTGWLLRILCGITHEVRGREHIPAGPAIVAVKHQSAWETLNLVWILPDPAIVMKTEVARIPLFGLFTRHFGNIPVDRDGKARALRTMVAAARGASDDGRPVLIFPEGTRREPGAPPAYQRGIIALYRRLGVACVPVALNSGLAWPARTGPRGPGHIIVEFLPAIAPGLGGEAFLAELEARIEPATARLVAEGKGGRQAE